MNERDRRLAQRELERRNRLISAGKSTLSAVPSVPDSRVDANGERRREMEEYQLKLNDQRARFAVHQDQQQQLQNGQHQMNVAAEMESQERAAMVQAALDRYHKERSLRDAIYEEKRRNFKQRRSGSQGSNNESQGTGEVPPPRVQEQPHRLMQAAGGMQWPAALSEAGDGGAYGRGSHQSSTPMAGQLEVSLPGMDAGDLREQRDAQQHSYGQQLRDQMLERVRRSQEEQMAALRESKAAQGGESEGQGARHGLLSKDTYRAALQQQIEDQRAYSRHDPTMGEVGGWQDDGYTRDPQGLSKQQYREALQQQLAEQHHQLGHRAGRGMDDGVFQLDGGPAQGQAHPQALRKEQYRHALQQQMAEQHRAGQPPASVDHDYASSLPGMGGQQHGRDNPHALSKEQYRDALERQIAEQQRHKRPQPTSAYQEDPEDGYLSGASLPGQRAEDQRHRSRLSKEEYRDVLEQQIAEQRQQSGPMQSRGHGTGGLLPGPPSTTTRTNTQHPHARRLSKDEYRDVLEQQIAEKRHQPKSRGGLGTTRRNKRTLPGGRGDTDQPRRLTKEEYRDALEQQIGERQQPRPRTVVRQGRDGEGTLGLLPGGAVPINPRGDRDHPHKLSKEEYREALEQQIAEQHHQKAVPERDTWPTDAANAYPPRRTGEAYPRQDRGQDGHRSTFEPARRAGDHGSYGGYGDDQAGRQGPSGRDLGPAAGMAGGYGGYGDEHMGRHGPAGGGGGGSGGGRQYGGYEEAMEPPARRSLGPPAGGWHGEDQSQGGSGYAPAPLESPTLPGSYANSSAGRKGAGLSKEEYRAELERQMSEHRQRKLAEKERDRAEAAAVTLSLPSGRDLGRPSPPRHFGRPAMPPPAPHPQPRGYRPAYVEHAPEGHGHEHGAWAQPQAPMGQWGHMNQLSPTEHMGGYSSRRSRDDDHQGPTGLGLPSQRQAVRQSMAPPPADVYNPMPLGPAATGYYGQGVEEDRAREAKWRKAAYASELKQQMEEAKARKKRDKMESLMAPDPFPLGALGGSPSPPPRRAAVPLMPVPPPGPHHFQLMAPPAMPNPSASTPRLAVLEPPPHYTEQQQVPWHMQGAQQAYPSPEAGMSNGFLPGQGHVWGNTSDARGVQGHTADPASGFHPTPTHRRGHSYPVDEPTGLMIERGRGPGVKQVAGGVPYMHDRGALSPNWETEGSAFAGADGRKGRGQALREIQGLDDPHEAEKRMKQAAHAQMLTMQVEDNARRKAAEKAALADQEKRETERVERERQQMEVLYKAEQEKKRQEEEMKQMLQKQIEDKKRQQQEDKHRQLEEDRKDLERVQREQEQLQRKYEAEQKGKKPGWGSEDGGSALSRGQGGNRSPVFGREGDGRSSVASSDHRPLDSVASGLRSKQNDGLSPLKGGRAKHTEEPGGFYTGQDTGNSPFRSLGGELRKYRDALEGLKEETGKAREEALRARAEHKHVQGEVKRLKARISDGEAGAGMLRGVGDLPKILDDPLDLMHMWMVPGPEAEATERNGRPESLDYLPRACNEMEKVLKCDDMNANFKGLSLNMDDQSSFSTGCRDKDNKLYGLHNLGFAETLRPAKFAWTGAEAEAGRSPQRAYFSPTKITSNQNDEQTCVAESLKADTHFVFPDGRRFTGGCGNGLSADPFVSAEPDAITVGRGAEQVEVETRSAGAGATACECVETVVCCQGAYCGDGACCCNSAVETTASAVDMFDVDMVLERAKDRCSRLELLGREGEMGDDVYKFLRRSRKYVDGYLPVSDEEEGECAQEGGIDRKRPDDDVDLHGSVRWVTREMGAIGMPLV